MAKDAKGHGSEKRGGVAAGVVSSHIRNLLAAQKQQAQGQSYSPAPPYPVATAAHQAAVSSVGQGFRTASPAEFLAARNQSPRAEMFTPHQPEDLGEHKLFMTPDGKIGAAVDKHGDIQSVFNNSGV